MSPVTTMGGAGPGTICPPDPATAKLGQGPVLKPGYLPLLLTVTKGLNLEQCRSSVKSQQAQGTELAECQTWVLHSFSDRNSQKRGNEERGGKTAFSVSE
ncbi:hypothetical protein BTVI_58235 [Pitangus sulphuratus]|nr:hypothetical protein BTVI_58235 [Pitangus sulphuratus]